MGRSEEDRNDSQTRDVIGGIRETLKVVGLSLLGIMAASFAFYRTIPPRRLLDYIPLLFSGVVILGCLYNIVLMLGVVVLHGLDFLPSPWRQFGLAALIVGVVCLTMWLGSELNWLVSELR